MEETRKFLRLLWRYRIILTLIPLITLAVTFYSVRNLPDTYTSETQIATGIIDEIPHDSLTRAGFSSESGVNQKFVSLIESVKAKSLIDQVSYQLILHDLTSQKSFKDLSILHQNGFNAADEKHAIHIFQEKYKNGEALNLRNPQHARLAAMLRLLSYDSRSILVGLNVSRLGDSDFIHLDYTSENAEVSAFVVNGLARELIKLYTNRRREDQLASIGFLQAIMRVKTDTLNDRVKRLGYYKTANRILDLPNQSLQALNGIATYKAQKLEAEKNMASLKRAIANVDRKINPLERRYAEAAMTGANQEALKTRMEVQFLVDKYVNNDFDETYKESIDSLQQVLTSQIDNINNKYIASPRDATENLMQQKSALQVQYDMAVYRLNLINRQIDDMSSKLNTLVPHGPVITNMERDVDMVSQEYQDLLKQYNQISMESSLAVKLRQVQLAMPGVPNPSEKTIIVILSGIISVLLCVATFLLIFLFDDRIDTSLSLAVATKNPVLGHLNLVGRSSLDLKSIWKNLHGTREMQEFKKQLRSARFEVNRELELGLNNSGKILSLTSINEGEGKTLIAACIAYTYVMVSKKVLLIDGNFDHPSITGNSNTQFFVEDYLQTGKLDHVNFNSGIMIMGNRGGDKSLLEVIDEETIRHRMEELKTKFDIILIEAPALSALNKAKEWILFSDKTMGVFEANQTLTADKKQHLYYLNSINGKFIGWILNKAVSAEIISEKIEMATVIE